MHRCIQILSVLFSLVLTLVLLGSTPGLAQEADESAEEEQTDTPGDDVDSSKTPPSEEGTDDDEETDEEETDDEETDGEETDGEEEGFGEEIMPVIPEDEGSEGEDPAEDAGEDGGFGEEIAPVIPEDEGDDAGQEDEGFGEEIAPVIPEDEGDDAGQEDEGFGEEIAPVIPEDEGDDAGQEDEGFGEEIAPVIPEDEGDDAGQEDEGFGEEIAPVIPEDEGDDAGQEDEGFGEEIAPVIPEDEGDDAGQEDEGFGEEIAPVIPEDEGGESEDSEEGAQPEYDMSVEEEDELYEQFWDELEEEDNVQEELPPEEEMAEGRGRIVGELREADFNSPVFDAVVSVEPASGGTARKSPEPVRTGSTGQFFFEVEPGSWVVDISHTDYKREAYQVDVVAGETTDLGTTTMRVNEDTTETIVVEARATRGTAATELLERKESLAVQDAISAEQISKSPDSDAKSAVRRVVSATIVDDKFLFVRGLGGRYTLVTLNGVEVPITDPDYPGVQLDLFPTALLSGLTIRKTFTPDLFGSFTGGIMDLETRNYPDGFETSLGVSVSMNTSTHFSKNLEYEGGSLDALGFDDGTRSLPGAIPSDQRVETGRSGLSVDQVESIGESFANVWEYERHTSIPNIGVSGSIGDTVKAGGRDLGYLVTFDYDRGTSTSQGTLRNVRLEGTENPEVTTREELDAEVSTIEVLWGLLGTVTYNVAEGSDIGLVTLYSQSADDSAQLVQGYSDAEGADIEAWQFQWVQRSIFFSELWGEHRDLFWDSQIDWRVAASIGTRDEPDTRDLTYLEGPEGFQYRAAPGSGERFFSELFQLDLAGGLDWKVPFADVFEVQLGGAGRYTDRDFESRRFRFDYIGSSAAARGLAPSDLFGADSIGTNTEITEITLPTDGYTAQQQLGAGYATLVWNPIPTFRALAGARFEHFGQDLEASSPFARAEDAEVSSRTDNDVLPAAGVSWEFTENMFLRSNYGGTVARPQIREVAPFLFQDYVRRRTVQGNPDLERTFIHNVDLRWEWYPDSTEVISATAFAKFFSNPIEQVILDPNGNITYQNVDGARNFGGELEARFGLHHFADVLRGLTIGSNVALVYSEVQLSEEQKLNATNSERPLAGQSPWVVNASLGYEHEGAGITALLYYNVFGRRIEEVGLLGLPDVYLQPIHQLDFTFLWRFEEQWRLKLSAKNLLHQRTVEQQGDINVVERQAGTSVSVGLKWSY